jgi:hypothetical protein
VKRLCRENLKGASDEERKMKTPFERGQSPEGAAKVNLDGLLHYYPDHC